MNPMPELTPMLKELRLSGVMDSLEQRNSLLGAATIDRLGHGAYKVVLEGKSFRCMKPDKKTQNQATKKRLKILLRKEVKNANLIALRDPCFYHSKLAPSDRTWVAPLG